MTTPPDFRDAERFEQVTMPRDIARRALDLVPDRPGAVLELLPGYYGRREHTGDVIFFRLKSPSVTADNDSNP